MEPQKVQHEITPELEEKITSIAKKGIKIYLFFILVSFIAMLLIFTGFYLSVIKPQQEEAKKSKEAYDKEVQQMKQDFERSQKEAEERFQQKSEQLKKEFLDGSSTVNKLLPSPTIKP